MYEVKVPGQLDQGWIDWSGDMVISVEADDGGFAITTLKGEVDQAALQGLLRRLYSLGLPLLSVNWIE